MCIPLEFFFQRSVLRGPAVMLSWLSSTGAAKDRLVCPMMFISFISLGPLDGRTLGPGEGPNIVGYDRISETVIVGLECEGETRDW